MGSRLASIKRFGIRTGIISLGLLCLAAGLLFLLTISPGERLARRIATDKLRTVLGQEVDIGDLETNLVSRISLCHVQIYQVQQGDTTRFLHIDQCQISYNLRQLLKRRMIIETVSVEGIDVFIHRDSTGSDNLPAVLRMHGKKEDSSGRIFQVQLQELMIRNARAEFKDEAGKGLRALFYDIDISAIRLDTSGYSCQVMSGGGRVELDTLSLPFEALSLEGSFGAGNVNLDSLVADIAGLMLKGSSVLKTTGDEPALAGDFRLTGNVEQLLFKIPSALPRGIMPVKGRVDMVGHVQGTISQPYIDCAMDVPALEIAGMHPLNVIVQASVTPSAIRVDHLEMAIFGGDLTGTATINRDLSSDSKIHLSLDRLDLREVLARIHNNLLPYQGKVSGSLSATGLMKDPLAGHIESGLKLHLLKFKSVPQADIGVEATLHNGQAEFCLRQDHAFLITQLELRDKRLTGRFSAQVARIEPPVSLFNIPELSGEVELTGEIEGEMDSPVIRADLEARDLKYRNFPIDTLSCGILFRKDRLHIPNLFVAGIQDSIDTASPPFGLAGLSGGFTYRGCLNSYPEDTSGDVWVDLSQPRFREIGCGEGRLHLAITPGKIDLISLSLIKDDLMVRGSGEFHIPEKSGRCNFDLMLSDSDDTNLIRSTSDPASLTFASEDPYPRRGTVKASFRVLDHAQYAVFDLEDQGRVSPPGWGHCARRNAFPGEYQAAINTPVFQIAGKAIS